MKILILCLLTVALVVTSGCTGTDHNITERYKSQGTTVNIISGNLTYPAYLAAPSGEGKKPAIVLIHSINGFEPGYRNLADMLAEEGYVVLAPQWQTFERTPRDEKVERLILDSVAYLKARPDVDANHLGLTGFCIGGRYTMLFLPQMVEF